MMDQSWIPLFLILVDTLTVVNGQGIILDQISNSSNPTTTSFRITRVAESSTTGSEHWPQQQQQQKPVKFFSNYEKLNIWLKRFNARFQPLMNKCLHTKCQCLADLNHLAALANVTKLIENRTSTERLDLKERRKLATILLTNIIRLDGYQQIQAFRWYQCRLSAESICPSIKQIPEDYYQTNRVQLLSLLMAEVVQNNTSILSIYSYEFVQSLDELLRRLNRNLVPTPMDSNHSIMTNKWFGRENLIADLDRINDPDPLVKVESLALLIVNRLVKGENIELFESRFLRNIIQHYLPETVSTTRSSTKSTVHMDQLGLVRMLKDLHIGGLIENQETPEEEMSEMETSLRPHTHHVEVPENETVRAERRIALNKALEDGECLNLTFYLDFLKTNPNLLTEQDIAQLAPIFVQQIVSKSCEHLDGGQLLESGYSQQIISLDGQNAIIYSILAVAAISVSSLFGVLLIPFLKSRAYSLMIDMLIGLAFGSMSGDALFHLIPSVLGIHVNDHEEHNHEEHGKTDTYHHHDHGDHHDHEKHEVQYLWIMLAVLISIYILFLFEVISNSIAKLKNERSMEKNPDHQHHHRKLDHQGHHHTIRQKDSDSTTNTSFKSSQTSIGITENPYAITNKISTNSIDSDSNGSKPDLPLSTSQSRLMHNNGTVVICGMTSLALILSISDSIHNLLDGVAIGISFSNSISRGLSTSIAVFFHEVPHEFGDFAVMLSTGMSIKRAAWVNFLSALTAFIGLAIGLWLGTSEQANRWALAVCAGLFLYISLCDMLPELKEMIDPPFSIQWLLTFSVKNAGILLGYLCMILVALYEDHLNFA